MDTVPEFHAEAPQATVSERLAHVERDCNPRSSGRKASTLPMRHDVPHVIHRCRAFCKQIGAGTLKIGTVTKLGN